MNKFEKYLKAVIRIGLGLFFIVSAILKLLSLDNFELYIYSFNRTGGASHYRLRASGRHLADYQSKIQVCLVVDSFDVDRVFPAAYLCHPFPKRQ